jgi:hypothetical protein
MQNQLDSVQSAAALHTQCLSALGALQNPDGGWPFHSGGQSRVEPTCWAALAIFNSAGDLNAESFCKLREYLQSTQLADGSWPASPEIATGSWITSLAAMVLSADSASEKNVAAALKWLCEDLPRDSSPFRRFLQSLRPKSEIVSQNDSYRGWGWTPKTASWVEPTSFALMALRRANPKKLPPAAGQRRELAISLLYDRMCPGGGWNCGNPRVYGVDGDALVLATCWALLALKNAPEKRGRAISLDWLQKEFRKIQSAASLAVAHITFDAYGITPPSVLHSLTDWSASDFAEAGTHALAWACIAANPARQWPPTSNSHATGSPR